MRSRDLHARSAVVFVLRPRPRRGSRRIARGRMANSHTGAVPRWTPNGVAADANARPRRPRPRARGAKHDLRIGRPDAHRLGTLRGSRLLRRWHISDPDTAHAAGRCILRRHRGAPLATTITRPVARRLLRRARRAGISWDADRSRLPQQRASATQRHPQRSQHRDERDARMPRAACRPDREWTPRSHQ